MCHDLSFFHIVAHIFHPIVNACSPGNHMTQISFIKNHRFITSTLRCITDNAFLVEKPQDSFHALHAGIVLYVVGLTSIKRKSLASPYLPVVIQ